MCGRYTLRRFDLLRQDFAADYAPTFETFDEKRPRFNIAPSQHVPIVRLSSDGKRTLSAVRWGLIPSWTKGKPKQQPINARAETIATSGMFRQAFARRRCLIPADGFYEWQKVGGQKQPMFVRHADDRLFAFAGIWERWKPEEDAEPIDTMSIITTEPNSLMSPIHDRMPVILSPQDYDAWLDRDAAGDAVSGLLKPYREHEMAAVAVSTRCNSPANDDCDCVAPLAVE
ncbi:MAG TPA: SOS response-associated peptidase [Tepidisphaeraceae bacterium]|jgi:putative SOS response-associated peptidase YedK